MNNDDFLIQLFLYFAKFPKKEGVLELFNVGSSSMDGYTQLRSTVQSLQGPPLTDIDNYIFGANFDAVTQRVNNIPSGSCYLFVDFGEIDCHTDRSNRMADSSRLAITVAYRIKAFSVDLIEQTLAFNHSLQKIAAIRNTIYRDQRCTPWLKTLSPAHQFLPFVSREMSSIGWSLMFTRESFDTFDAKKHNL